MSNKETHAKKVSDKVIIKKCHVCGQVAESAKELERCLKCNKAFLPLNYFSKVHDSKSEEYQELFSHCDELEDEDLVVGLYVLW